LLKENDIKELYDNSLIKPEPSRTNQIRTDDKINIKETAKDEVKHSSLGEFKLTAYCSCEVCCGEWAYNRPNGVVYGAIGEELIEGYSIAVDPNVIPYRAEVVLDGKTYKAQDFGGAINGNRIDVYFEDHNEALEFGVQYTEVFLVE
jgi:3D (Asp-Asp-Asp) domain-containing protein